jgi:tol-pal system protein YbgF
MKGRILTSRLSAQPRIHTLPFYKTFAGSWAGCLLVVACLFMACGGSKNTNVSSTNTDTTSVDIDNLLNSPDQQQAGSEDAEVLRLLGIEPAKSEAAKTPPAATEPNSAEMQKEIDRLQRELNAKDQQVADLRNSLMERDARLQEMQKAPTGAVTATFSVDGFLQRYAEARNLYEQRRYTEAITLFQQVLAENPQSSYADNCQYWIGECYYGLGKFAQSVAEFEEVLAFARSNKKDAALLKLGLCHVRMGDRQQARSLFEQLIAYYPSSPYVANARKYLSRL